MTSKLSKTFIFFLIAIFTVNLVQSYFTELIFDEAYYWYYAQKMAWGYFDHPPMVALLIKISGFFFDGELGVRFMSCILSVGTYIVIWDLVDNGNKKGHVPLFFILGLSFTLLHAYGFLTLPDTPLLFFTALFLWSYKKFINGSSAVWALVLGLVMAALMYSKYHAVLVIVFVLLSNIKLVFDKYAWLAVVFALLCYTPHFIWLLDNDFVSVKYHLTERPNQAYSFEIFTFGFFLNLIALFGFTFPMVYWALYKTKITDRFIKALIYLTYGVVVFFFISSFNRRVQTQWIIVISIPLLVLVYAYALDRATYRKWIFRLAIANLVILSYARLWFVHRPLLPMVYESHDNRKWVKEITDKVADMPIVFENSYRNAPMYSFYSGNTSFSLNNIMYRHNQYTIDSSEYKVQHKKILYVSGYLKAGDITLTDKEGGEYYGKYIEDFESFRKLRCVIDEEVLSLEADDELTLKVYNPYSENIGLEKIKFNIAYLDDYKKVKEVLPMEMELKQGQPPFLKLRDTTYFTFRLPMPKKAEPLGYIKFSISENGLFTGINGKSIPLE